MTAGTNPGRRRSTLREMAVRLQKLLADSGVASRRGAETFIEAGRVTVNGVVVSRLGTTVDPRSDRVELDGKVLRIKPKLYLALNKPKGYICSRDDERGRRTVFDLLPSEWSHVFTVGRLDGDSEGLIFLTNDGDFSLRLSHPRFGVVKRYLVKIAGRANGSTIEGVTRGVQDQGEWLRAAEARIVRSAQQQSLIELDLVAGKKREIRRLFQALGYHVLRLQRIQIGQIKLGDLPSGRWRTLNKDEVATLTRHSGAAKRRVRRPTPKVSIAHPAPPPREKAGRTPRRKGLPTRDRSVHSTRSAPSKRPGVRRRSAGK